MFWFSNAFFFYFPNPIHLDPNIRQLFEFIHSFFFQEIRISSLSRHHAGNFLMSFLMIWYAVNGQSSMNIPHFSMSYISHRNGLANILVRERSRFPPEHQEDCFPSQYDEDDVSSRGRCWAHLRAVLFKDWGFPSLKVLSWHASSLSTPPLCGPLHPTGNQCEREAHTVFCTTSSQVPCSWPRNLVYSASICVWHIHLWAYR